MKNRTVIGIICIIAALAIAFGIAPLVNTLSDGKTEIVRVISDVPRGSVITGGDIGIVTVSSYNLPGGVVKDKSEVIGKYAACNLYAGDYILPSKLTDKSSSAEDTFMSLDGEKYAISISIASFASGLSGKLENGDIVSIIVYQTDKKSSFIPDALQYVRVITTTTSSGVDKDQSDGTSQPVTVTLLVNTQQALLLSQYESTAKLHFILVCRGSDTESQRFIDIQDAYFSNEGVNANG